MLLFFLVQVSLDQIRVMFHTIYWVDQDKLTAQTHLGVVQDYAPKRMSKSE